MRRTDQWSRNSTSNSPGSHAGEISSQSESTRKSDAGDPALSTETEAIGALTDPTVPA
jgi:hypothetical protein